MISYILKYFEHPLSLFFLLKSDGKIKYLKDFQQIKLPCKHIFLSLINPDWHWQVNSELPFSVVQLVDSGSPSHCACI